MSNSLFVDIAYKQKTCNGEYICGDSIAYKRMHTENRTVIILSDGMGHGVKANVLSNLTASMLVNFASAKEDIRKTANIVLNNLPVCSVRKISYSTFTVIEIDHKTHEVTIAEHDNPQSIVFRGDKILESEWETTVISESTPRLQTIRTTKFNAQEGDRIIFMSDGVTQSGLGTDIYPFGWGRNNVEKFIKQNITENQDITSKELSSSLSLKAVSNDDGEPKDDISSVAVHFHKPKKLLIASCPPAQKGRYPVYASKVSTFNGNRILCGYPISEIVAQILGRKVIKDSNSPDPDIPPLWYIEGIDLVTEGFVTINKVYELLSTKADLSNGEGAAYEMCRMLTSHDEIEIMLGTKRSRQGSVYMHDEFELRRKALVRIGELLEKNYFKEVIIGYI